LYLIQHYKKHKRSGKYDYDQLLIIVIFSYEKEKWKIKNVRRIEEKIRGRNEEN
jgi:hypothetical protein